MTCLAVELDARQLRRLGADGDDDVVGGDFLRRRPCR